MITMQVIDGIGLPQVGLGSGWAVMVLMMVFIMRGTLVPRRTLEDALHDRDEWRAESRIKDAQLAEKDEQLRHMGEVGRTVDQIMRALPGTASEAKS
ncbi:hypothetical protein [Nocardioides sp. SR21]|uniref:hypothetical protein n=1 Tax=Nocardioides sp. SR21 TaxID=2919501 RepID=UPI001FAA7676|nr:hypothetical protein [Nocardioides sp. SR21]